MKYLKREITDNTISRKTSFQENIVPSTEQSSNPISPHNGMLGVGFFSFPTKSTINVYRDLDQCLFTSHNSRIDLHDVLTTNIKSKETQHFFIGVSTKNANWDYWTNANKQKIENRIRYLFEFENIDVCINPLLDVDDAPCVEEFIWEIEFSLA